MDAHDVQVEVGDSVNFLAWSIALQLAAGSSLATERERSVVLDLVECASPDALVAQGLLAVDGYSSPDGMPANAFLFRGTGSVNMFDLSREPKADGCRSVGRAVIASRQVTARLPRACGEREWIVVSDLMLVESDRPLGRLDGVVVGHVEGREVGRLVATGGRFGLLTGVGSVGERISRGSVPEDVKDFLKGTAQVVGVLPEGAFLVAEEATEESPVVRVESSGRVVARRSLPMWKLAAPECSK